MGAVVPALAEALAAPADRVEAEPAHQSGRDLEPGREDEEVERILRAVDDRPRGGHFPHTASVGVDDVHVRPVERREVLVVEAQPLAVLAVPGLQLLRDLGILDDLVDSATHGFHHLEVDGLEFGAFILGRGDPLGVGAHGLGPPVVDQVTVGMVAGHDLGEVAGPLLLPAGREGTEPRLVDRLLPAYSDGRRSSLKDVDLLGGAG